MAHGSNVEVNSGAVVYDPDGYGWSGDHNIMVTPSYAPADATGEAATAIRFRRTPDEIAAALLRVVQRLDNGDIPAGNQGFVRRLPS